MKIEFTRQPERLVLRTFLMTSAIGKKKVGVPQERSNDRKRSITGPFLRKPLQKRGRAGALWATGQPTSYQYSLHVAP
jgi:hypothetical protein